MTALAVEFDQPADVSRSFAVLWLELARLRPVQRLGLRIQPADVAHVALRSTSALVPDLLTASEGKPCGKSESDARPSKSHDRQALTRQSAAQPCSGPAPSGPSTGCFGRQ
jgi:hypothetical protein